MKSAFIIPLLALLAGACANNQQPTNQKESFSTTKAVAQSIELPQPPASFTSLDTATGDLDKDGINELVAVYDTPKETDMGTERQVYIYKQKDGKWDVWHKSIGMVQPSQHGGTMGDSFQEIRIERGCIVTEHFGGSSDKWTYTHRYRFQDNDWYLIGATIHYGAMCKGWSNYDYNLSTGRVDVETTTSDCDDNGEEKESKATKSSFVAKLQSPVKMDGFAPGDNEVNMPGKEDSFYY